MHIFSEDYLSDYLDGNLEQLKDEVFQEVRNKLLNVNEAEYIKYLVSKYGIAPLEMQWDSQFVSDREKKIPAEMFSMEFDTRRGGTYPRQAIAYHIPYTGDRQLFRFRPSSYISWDVEIIVSHDEICFEIINMRNNIDDVKREAGRYISNIRQLANSSTADVNRYNNELESKAREYVRVRKEQHLKQSEMLAGLGVPLKKADSIPATFSVPVAPKRIVVKKPEASSAPFQPEPTLDNRTYDAILSICRDTGVAMERTPSIYVDKEEETLRDHFIMVLSTHFPSSTGETFNKKGKTDILIRYENANVFVAECKYWSGKKGHFETIDQILSYLTWRDSKSSILYFVKNVQLDRVFETIASETKGHQCFVSEEKIGSEGISRFNFHLAEDSSRGVVITIMCFHFPIVD